MVLLMGRFRFAASAIVLAAVAAAQNISFNDVLKLPRPPADHRIAYGSDANQFGYLRLPKGRGPRPVVIFIHGGCWRTPYDVEHTANLCGALTDKGLATWSLEYRRVGNPGGGWPGTFLDIAAGVDHLRALAAEHRLDLRRVVVAGHSAGGHLALWTAARRRLPQTSALYVKDPLPVRGAVSLAGPGDLRSFGATSGVCGDAIPRLFGGPPEQASANYAQGSPLELLPIGLPQRLLFGGRDPILPPRFGQDYQAAARKAGDDVELTVFDDAGHFEFISLPSAVWPAVEKAVLALLGDARRR